MHISYFIWYILEIGLNILKKGIIGIKICEKVGILELFHGLLMIWMFVEAI